MLTNVRCDGDTSSVLGERRLGLPLDAAHAYGRVAERIRYVHAAGAHRPSGGSPPEHLGDGDITVGESSRLRDGYRTKQLPDQLFDVGRTRLTSTSRTWWKLQANDRTHAVTLALGAASCQI